MWHTPPPPSLPASLRPGLEPNAAGTCAQLGLAWTALELASVSVRSGDCLSAFVYLVKGSNSWVGYVQGINGIMQVHTSINHYVPSERTNNNAC